MSALRKKALLSGSVATLIAAWAGPAFAQSEAVDTKDIVVTAAKRESRLQDTALAINALSADKLDAASVTDTAGLQTAVPSLQFAAGAGASFVYLRGVGANVFGAFSDNSVATYVDGVYIPRPTAAVQEFMDVERVEVLRGPQATLYGRNATGGAILIASAAPSDVFTGSADARIGNEGTRRYRAMISGPLVENKLAVRLSAVRAVHSGYSTNLVDGSDYDTQDFWGVRGSLRWTPTEDLSITVIGNYSAETGSPGSQKSAQNSLPFRPFPFNRPYSADPRASYRNITELNPSKTGGGQVNLQWDMGFAALTSITSYQRYKIGPTFFDLDDSDAPLLEYRGQTGDTKFFYQDLYLTSQPGRLEWMIGATVADEKTALDLPTLTPGGLNRTISSTNVDAYAIYGQLGFNVTDQLKLVAAARYSDETRSGVSDRRPPFGPSSIITNKASWNDTSPKLSVEWRPTDQILVYGSATHGFKSGVFDPQNVSITARPETIWSYEGGARTQWFDNRLTLNATAFHYDYKDLQVFSGVIQGPIVQTVLQNAGKANVNGLELEASFRLLPTLQIGGTLSLLDGQYGSGTVLADLANAVPAPPGGSAQVPSADVGGRRMILAPKTTVTLFADWRVSLGSYGGLRFYADYFRQSARYFSAFEDPTLRAKAYDIVNARMTYSTPDDRFSVAAFVRNWGDTLVVSKLSRVPPFGTLATYGAPRLYGVEVGFRF